MNMQTIVAFCICGCILVLTLRQYQRPQALLLGLAVSGTVLLSVMPAMQEILATASVFFGQSGLETGWFTVLCKAVGISYLTQLGVDFCRDCGENAICSVVEISGRLCLVSLSVPLLGTVSQVVLEVMG
ncbi:MAG: hypothetical protein IJN11_04105 [Oscillospiraceae bacterium]|nr:hypothetical protein [Ruminococcus sp.]MBQ7003812.1 hypothetical protein [Oscillospiraceae bacterium]MBQ7013083.1 hypothetical protein [Oscillospiraceae bacterium]